MEREAWKQLLDELSLYIDENYEGARLIPVYCVAEEPTQERPKASSVCEPPSAPVQSVADVEDPFDDIRKIFGEDEPVVRRVASAERNAEKSSKKASFEATNIEDLLASLERTETFSEALLRIIKEKDLIEADVYNRVFMDRKLFNKIRNDRAYQPSKRTALLLSVALRLTVTETKEFLEKAGFSLTHTSKTDIVIEFFMMRGNYDVIEINAALYEHRLPPLNK